MLRFVIVLITCVVASSTLPAGDWPQWRGDANRGATTQDELPEVLMLHWERQLAPARPAWPRTQPKLQFDLASHPVVSGRTLIVNSSVNDCVQSLDTRSGRLKWTFYANGPVRFAPIIVKDRVYFTSDDGYLYCLEAGSGELLWKFHGAPTTRWILGNERLISSWPARGGPVWHNGRVFFAASIWPFMGVFVHAVDAESGEAIWTNSGDGMNLTEQPHGASSFATVAPQGHLVVSDGRLIVPGGRSVPAIYDLDTGKLLHFHYDKYHGGHFVSAAGSEYFVAGGTYDLATGKRVEDQAPVVVGNEAIIFAAERSLAGKSRRTGRQMQPTIDRHGNRGLGRVRRRRTLFAHQMNLPLGDVLLQSGSRLWTAANGEIRAFDLRGSSPLRPIWRHAIEGDIWEAIAADDRLFVVTLDNRILCFGPGYHPTTKHKLFRRPLRPTPAPSRIAHLLQHCKSMSGYAIVLGIGSGELIKQLVMNTQLTLIVLPFDADAESLREFRLRYQSSGDYGHRLSLLEGEVLPDHLPPYLANLIISESPEIVDRFVPPESLASWFERLRPYGGRALLPSDAAVHKAWLQQLNVSDLHGAQIFRRGAVTTLTRSGALPQTDDWTHQYANAAQTGISLEARVKAPLGILWFGGPSHEGILPRHGHGPAPQVAGGRIVIEGPDILRCVDVYTGRKLWERQLNSLGSYYNTTRHFSGAGEIGSNYVTLADSIYVVFGPSILKLDAASGRTAAEFHSAESTDFGYLSVWDDLLIATSSPLTVSTSNLSQTRSVEPIVLDDERAVIPPAARWSYLAGRDPKSNWTRPEFADAHWQQGHAGFGYGDDDDRTVLHGMAGKYSRVYLRHEFHSDEVDDLRQLTLLIRFDDAFIAYLNGHEIARSSITGRGRDAKVEMHEAGKFQVVPLHDWRRLIRHGKNVFAIEAHNIGLASSDFTIDPYLVGRRSHEDHSLSEARLRDFLQPTRYASGSQRLVVFNRHTGQKLWHRDAKFNFRHNNIAVGGGKIFCIDRLSDAKRISLQRRGVQLDGAGHLMALDARTGSIIWETDDRVFGTFLNYSEQYDTLVQGGSAYRDRAADEVKRGIVAYRGRDGLVRWSDDKRFYAGPLLLWQNQILTNGNGGIGIDLLSGVPTGFNYHRDYGCNTAVGCQNLLTFRSGAAGFLDLLHQSGTGNLGGFRSSCTNNLIPANGVLAVPDYTRTCACAYQNQTSLALVHMPTAEYWTYGGLSDGRIGLNFGAPGDRRAANGTLWVDYPSVGGKSPLVAADIRPRNAPSFRRHASLVEGRESWIAASGLIGVRRIKINVKSNAKHRLRLVFSEPEPDAPRRFDVKIQGQIRLSEFSPQESAEAPLSAVSRTFNIAPKKKTIEIEFLPKTRRQPVISGLEIIEEGS